MRMKRVFSIAFALVLGAALLQASPASAQQDEGEGTNDEPTVKELQQKKMVGEKIHFAFDSSELDAEARTKLDEIASWAKENPDRTILIAGHTDEVGTREYNQALGDRRAEAAKRYLVDSGVPANRIQVQSFGESLPVEEDAGKSETNRRDVFLVDRQEEPKVEEQPITEAPADEGAQPTEEAELERQRREQELAQQREELERQRREQELERQRREQEMARQQQPQPTYTQAPAEPVEEDEDDTDRLLTPAGLSINLGGGVLDYFDDETRDFTDTAGMWEARLVYGTRAPVAIEAGYVGFAQNIDALGLDSDAVLLGSLFEGAVRVNLPVGVEYVQPYAFGGVGVTRMDVVNESFNTSSVKDDDTSYHFPAGVGVGFRYEGFLVDIRGTVRPTVDDELLVPSATPTEDDEARLHNWSAAAKLGWEF